MGGSFMCFGTMTHARVKQVWLLPLSPLLIPHMSPEKRVVMYSKGLVSMSQGQAESQSRKPSLRYKMKERPSFIFSSSTCESDLLNKAGMPEDAKDKELKASWTHSALSPPCPCRPLQEGCSLLKR